MVRILKMDPEVLEKGYLKIVTVEIEETFRKIRNKKKPEQLDRDFRS